jgi:hypothetical protein
VSAVHPELGLPAAATGGDLFEWYRDGTGVVLQHGTYGLAAAGESRDIDVSTGPDHVRRAAALAQNALGETHGLGVAMGALPYKGSCAAILRVPERVIRGVPARG